MVQESKPAQLLTELPLNQIIQGDCLEVMKQMPDKCVDLVLTDPPYGIGISNSQNRMPSNRASVGQYGDEKWDNFVPDKEVFDEILRVSKNQIIFGGNYFAHSLPLSRCWLVWYKRPVGNISPCELAWTSFSTGGTKQYEYLWEGYWQGDMKNKEQRVHPTQKPIKLFDAILRDYSKENDLIFDPFLGSGTTAVAAKQLKRNFIGIEISEKYCEIARQRVAQAQVPML